jgi:enhancing lycopene biosynthesis protein 2
MIKAAVILCGSGSMDGSEIHESTFALLALDELDVQYQCFAPDLKQSRVMNFLIGQLEAVEERNQLKEAARIARGKIKNIEELNTQDFDILVLPGGYGAAFNLCNFATKGSQAEVLPRLSQIIQEFSLAQKPIGAICIAPSLVALSLKGLAQNLTLTAGNKDDQAGLEMEKLNCTVIPCLPEDCIVDIKNKVASTPAYMNAKRISEVHSGIKKMIVELVKMVK